MPLHSRHSWATRKSRGENILLYCFHMVGLLADDFELTVLKEEAARYYLENFDKGLKEH